MATKTRDPVQTRKTILTQSAKLFADKGFTGASMREIAREANLSAPTIYHYYEDKHELYLDTVRHAMQVELSMFYQIEDNVAEPMDRLRQFIAGYTHAMMTDEVVRRLIQRLLLERDEELLKLAAKEVFSEPFSIISDLAKKLAPEKDPHLLAVSIIGLIVYQLEVEPILNYLPGRKKSHGNPGVIADHVISLLKNGI